MSTQSEISRIEQAKSNIASAITAKGVSVPSGTKIDGMSSLIASISQGEDLDDEISEQDSLISQIQTALADKVAPDSSGGGGGSIETCAVTIIQSWGMNDDPLLLTLCVPYYNIETDGSMTYGYEEFTSQNDYEPQHSVTFTAIKNVPINIFAYGFSGTISCTPSNSGGTIEVSYQAEGERLYRLIPTENTATFTFAAS